MKTVVLSGATGAIGRAIAAGLAREPGLELVLLARDAAKAERLVGEIRRLAPSARVRAEIADLSRKREIVALSQRISGPVHVLVNNAAIAPRRRQETPEGIELQLATNVLGYVWMTELFAPQLERAHAESGEPARVVNVASYWAGDLELDDLPFRRRRYDNGTAYRQSKQANRMLTVAHAERFASRGISVNACHPGDVNSTLSNELGFGGSTSPEDGARTPLFLALAPEVAGTSGRWFEGEREQSCTFSRDRAGIAALVERCAAYA